MKGQLQQVDSVPLLPNVCIPAVSPRLGACQKCRPTGASPDLPSHSLTSGKIRLVYYPLTLQEHGSDCTASPVSRFMRKVMIPSPETQGFYRPRGFRNAACKKVDEIHILGYL